MFKNYGGKASKPVEVAVPPVRRHQANPARRSPARLFARAALF
jgi:hypothetical protein